MCPRRFSIPFAGLLCGVLAVGLVMALAACSPSSPTPVQLTAANSGTAQTLAPGQELTVSLESNPTTGYRWALDGALPSQLQQVGEPAYTSSSSAVGAGGTEVWKFTGQGSGLGTLKMKYWRSFEPTATPVKTFSATIEVK